MSRKLFSSSQADDNHGTYKMMVLQFSKIRNSIFHQNVYRQPLELHVMCFKTEYLTMEQAMKELDGIIVLAYLYQVGNNYSVIMS